jgi:hypothetical protein
MFRHARHSVMVGHHPDLAPSAGESVDAENERELVRGVADKIVELAQKWRGEP